MVEDDELIRPNTAELIRESGYVVIEAGDAHQGLASLGLVFATGRENHVSRFKDAVVRVKPHDGDAIETALQIVLQAQRA